MGEKAKTFFVSIASGSSGNCSYIGTDSNGFLIDAGIPYGLRSRSAVKNSKTLKQSLIENNIDIKGIKGLIISHCHFDHIRYAADYSNNADISIPVYISKKTHEMYEAIRKKATRKMEYKALDNIVYFSPEEDFGIESFQVLPIPVSHDAYLPGLHKPEDGTTFAFIIRTGSSVISHITDLGEISESIKRNSLNSRILHLEFNYDPEMLFNGKYPPYLKKRIGSRFGHLSNQDAVKFIMDYHLNTVESVSIAHISKENNSEERISKSIEPIAKNRSIRFFRTYHGHYSDKIFL